MSEMKEKINNLKDIFESYLYSKKSCFDSVPEPLRSGMLYSLDGGKRLRPVLAMLGAEFMQKPYEEVLDIALGMECIHNYSLVHDDLPCMDDDELRHGKATCHKKFGEGMAVLVGDALLNFAFEYMLNSHSLDTNYVGAVGYISKMSGASGMVAGQCIDIVSEDMRTKTLAEVIKLNMLKTACLFKGALVGSVISLGGSAEEIADLEAYAEKLGLIFQIVDDILDVTSTKEVMGKSVGKDDDQHKITYLSIVGMERAKQDISMLESEGIAVIEKYGDRANNLIEFLQYLTCRVY